MRLLILGGTAWLGRTIAQTALQAGHHVTCLARGSEGARGSVPGGGEVPDGAELVRADRDRDDALDPVRDARWDAVIDVATQPGHVRRSVRDLEPVAGRCVYVSTGSVYAEDDQPGADEDARLLEPLQADRMETMEQYGQAKAACEQAVLEGFGPQRSAIVRAGLIGGPGDHTGRTGYWPLRAARPSNPDGSLLVPDAPALPTALIDVRDLAAWIVRLAEGHAQGIFNTDGHPVPFPEHIELARRAAGHTGTVVTVAEDWLVEQGIGQWAGPRSLPLWIADPSLYGMNERSIQRALATGLSLRPLSETLADSLAWNLQHDAPTVMRAGLTDEEERALLDAWSQR